MVTDVHAPKNAWKVFIQPSGLAFESTSQLSLLNAALQARIRLPSSCRNGTCRTCLCLLKQGKIQYQIEWPGLTKEEKAEGWILPCVAIAESDLVLEVENAISLE